MLLLFPPHVFNNENRMGLFIRSYPDPWKGLERNDFYSIGLQKLTLNEGFTLFFQTQATVGGHRTLGVLIANMIYCCPVYSATFYDLSFTVSSALIKSLYSMSSLFNSFSESSKKQFPMDSTLTFFAHCLFPGD